MNNNEIELLWNESFETWDSLPVDQARPPGSAVGPAGPAGVSSLRCDQASVSFCVMTDRIVSVTMGPDPDAEAMALLRQCLDAESMARLREHAAPGPGQHRTVRAKADVDPRLPRLAHGWAAVVRLGEIEELSARDYIAWLVGIAEVARDVSELRASAPGLDLEPTWLPNVGAPGGKDRELGRLEVDEAIGFLDADDRRAVADVTAQLDTTLPASVAEALALVHQVASVPLDQEEVPHGGAVAEAPVEYVETPTVAAAGTNAWPGQARIEGTVAQLSPETAKALGCKTVVGVSVQEGWIEVVCPHDHGDGNAARRRDFPWVCALDADDRLIGGAVLTNSGDAQVAKFPLRASVQPVTLRFDDHHLADRGTDVFAAHRLAFAGWVAHMGSKPDRRALAEMLFAGAAVDWLTIGLTFRAGWAYQLADRGLVATTLRDRGAGELNEALEAVLDAEVLPDLTCPPRPVWSLIADPNTLARS